MSSRKRTALLILAVFLALCAAPVSAAGTDGAEFLGDWQLRLFKVSGYRYDSYPYEYGFEAVLSVREDGTAVLTETGKDYTSVFPGTWTSKRKNEFTIAFEDRDKVNFRLNRGVLKSYGGREIFTFTQHDTEGELSIGLPIDEYHFPDPKFRALLKDQFGYIQNCIPYLSQKEIKTMKELDCRGKDIDSMAGVRYLTELTKLICPGGKLESLDLSGLKKLKELDCGNNRLTALNLSGCVALTSLSCAGNRLGELDLSAHRSLRELYCSANQITSLNLENNRALKTIEAQDMESLTDLQLGEKGSLTTLCLRHTGITKLDLSKCGQLRKLLLSQKLTAVPKPLILKSKNVLLETDGEETIIVTDTRILEPQ